MHVTQITIVAVCYALAVFQLLAYANGSCYVDELIDPRTNKLWETGAQYEFRRATNARPWLALVLLVLGSVGVDGMIDGWW